MALCLLAALATVPRSAWVDDPSQGQFSAAPAAAENAPAEEVAAVAEAAMAQVVPAKSVRARLRCETCGVVESIERTEAVGAMPSVYKLTVRLRNGSRVTTAVGNTVGRWKVGDKIMIIGGA